MLQGALVVTAVLSIERRPLSARASDLFGIEFEVPVLAPDELYAGKLGAALDRQQPRDLFGVWQFFETGGLTDAMVECFVVYLAGTADHPMKCCLATTRISPGMYERAFIGMTEVACSLETLLDTRAQLRQELPQRLSAAHRQFLSGLTRT